MNKTNESGVKKSVFSSVSRWAGEHKLATVIFILAIVGLVISSSDAAPGISIGLWVVILIMIIVGLVKNNVENNKKLKQELEQALNSVPNFKPDNYYTSASSRVTIAFDDKSKKICFVDRRYKSVADFQKAKATATSKIPLADYQTARTTYVYDYSKILECELVIDGETVSKQSTGSTVGRAVLGSLLLGGVGAIIGGVTGSRRQKEEVKSMDLKIIVNDTANPVFNINFFTGITKKKSAVYKIKYAEIEKWHAIVSGLIRQGSDADTTASAGNGSVADELKKLKGLLDDGAITGAEYEKQKQKILA